MNDLSAPDKVAMALTLRIAMGDMKSILDMLQKVADTLDPPSDIPQHSTASHMS